MFIIAQTIVLLLAIVSAYVGLSNKVAIVETNQANLLKHIDDHADAASALEKKVHGISRRVERHQTVIELNDLDSPPDRSAQG